MRRDAAIAQGHEVTGKEPFNFFMAICYPADNLWVQDYNRVLKELNGLSFEQFLDGIKENFEVAEIQAGEDTKPKEEHHFSLHLDNKWFSMKLKPDKLNTDSVVS